jgi:hypothetical protein
VIEAKIATGSRMLNKKTKACVLAVSPEQQTEVDSVEEIVSAGWKDEKKLEKR